MEDQVLEGYKLLFDLAKHVTTLSTGTLVLTATLLEKLFKKPAGLVLIISSFTLLFMSILSGIMVMFVVSSDLALGPIKDFREGLLIVFATQLLTFSFGLLLMTLFALFNFGIMATKPASEEKNAPQLDDLLQAKNDQREELEKKD